MRTNRATLHLRALVPLEWKTGSTNVIEYLDGVPIDGVRFVAQLEQGNHWIRVNLAGPIFQRVNLCRVVQFRDNQRRSVRGHELAITPNLIARCT